MNARSPADLARHTILIIRGVRHASTAPQPQPWTIPPESYGKQIFVYNHVQKNHVVYSLTKDLKNHKALSQIPFNGKKTVPRALRKDHWTPLVTLTFPSGPIGLSVYQKLRELRRRHELEWTQRSLFPNEENDHKKKEEDDNPQGLSKKQIGKVNKRELIKKRGRALCDQRANSVADMAFLLGRLEAEAAATEALEKEEKKEGASKELELARTRQKAAAERGTGSLGLIGEGTGVEVLVEWRNLVDAEYAETWSGNVTHGELESTFNNRKMKSRKREVIEKPVVEVEGEEKEKEKEKEKERLAA